MTRRYDHAPQRQRPYSTEKLRQRVLTRSTFHGQAMHRSKSFRALVLFGVVALVTALYQSITPPSSALTIPTGLTPRGSVFKAGRARSYAFEFDAAGRSYGSVSHGATAPPHWRVAVLVPVPLCMCMHTL